MANRQLSRMPEALSMLHQGGKAPWQSVARLLADFELEALIRGLVHYSRTGCLVGGSVSPVIWLFAEYANLKERAEGTLSTQSSTELVFTTKKDGGVTIPYSAIGSLEYRQKAGRRVAVAVMVSPLALFSMKRITTSRSPTRTRMAPTRPRCSNWGRISSARH